MRMKESEADVNCLEFYSLIHGIDLKWTNVEIKLLIRHIFQYLFYFTICHL